MVFLIQIKEPGNHSIRQLLLIFNARKTRDMANIHSFLTHDLKRCIQLFSEAENAVLATRWDVAYACFALFKEAIGVRFSMEEKILFPAFEEKPGAGEALTAVMRQEHDQMCVQLNYLSKSLALKEKNSYLSHSEKLNLLMQRHIRKEKNAFRVSSDSVLSRKQAALSMP
jgi:hypothetical protein